MLVGRYVPHFGTVQHWDGTDTGDGPTTPLTDDQIAAEAWDGSGIDVQLTGHLTGCSHGTWVRDPSKPAPDIYADDAGDAKLSAALLAEFRGLDGWKAIQAEAKDADPPVTSKTWTPGRTRRRPCTCGPTRRAAGRSRRWWPRPAPAAAPSARRSAPSSR
ncbi:MAG: hypothetical protein U1F43_38670 [Myxococcota bacterium]